MEETKLNFDKPSAENEIFIKNKQPFRIYIKRIVKLLLKGYKEIIIKGLSASIKKSLKLLDKTLNLIKDTTYIIDSKTIECIKKIKVNDIEEYKTTNKSWIIITILAQ